MVNNNKNGYHLSPDSRSVVGQSGSIGDMNLPVYEVVNQVHVLTWLEGVRSVALKYAEEIDLHLK